MYTHMGVYITKAVADFQNSTVSKKKFIDSIKI